MAEETKSKRTWAERLWGRMAPFSWTARIVALVFVATTIFVMSYCQLGFWPIGTIDAKPVYLLLLLGPLVMGALLFGPIMGALLGLFAAAVVYSHALIIPLDFYEVYFMTVLNTFALLPVMGALSGILFKVGLGRNPKGAARVGLVAAICLVLSAVASGLIAVNTVIAYGGLDMLDIIREYLLNSPFGMTVQVLIDAVVMIVLCLGVDHVAHGLAGRRDERPLLSTFRNWMLLISAIVFMLASSFIFLRATAEAQEDAQTNMVSDADYLSNQINKTDTYDKGVVLEGYAPELDGYVVITDKAGAILASDDEGNFPVGESLIETLGYDEVNVAEGMSPEEKASAFFDPIVGIDDTSVLQARDENGFTTMEFIYIVARSCDDGYVCVMQTPDVLYRNRFETMLASTLLAIALIAAIGVLATALLNRVVVRRIDETNVSLDKITHGNLNERVSVRDSREFTSLSSGINTTVSALKDTIEEVEQRNAQDLATAKAIQESALPREFPPFPEIDRFDIYASMKTAKEVGGDFYDFFLIEDGDPGVSKLGFVMADVSGKGIPAALFMMAAKTQIRTYMEEGLSVGAAVDAANHQLCIGNDAGMFVTAWVGVLDYSTGQLSFVNAGHNPPMLRRNGAWEWVKDVSGMPLGLFDGIPYTQHELQLNPEDMLYTYTDGVTEAMNKAGELFGEERLEEVLGRFGSMNPRSVGVGVRRSLTDFTLDAEQSDDITMLILKYGVPPEKKAVMILPADDKQLVHVFNFVHEELNRRGAPRSVYSPLDIAAEELFVNVCHYAYPDATPDNPGEVRIGFEYEATPPSLTVTISDDGIPYDPLAKPDAVTPDDIADVPIGGLGILMAKRSVDEMTYERAGDSNVLTFVKRW